MRRLLVAIILVAGCGDDATVGGDLEKREVALVPATVNRDLDLLFLVDDSSSMLAKQMSLKNGFTSFAKVLNTVEGGLPNIHLGVITSDMGAKAADDAVVGTTAGMCAGSGKDGALQVYAAPVTDKYLIDLDNNGARMQNYSGSLEDAFKAMASAGANGCGFEQSLEAIRRSFEQPANAGFIRDNARLAIVVLTDEDDCSYSHTTFLGNDTASQEMYGPLNSFRCTRFGVQCDMGGTTSDEMNAVGMKSGCHGNESSPVMTDVGRYITFLKGLKPDPRSVLFAAIAAPATPVATEMRTPPGFPTAIPALAHSCTYTSSAGDDYGDPPVRIAQVASALRHGSVDSVCSEDLTTVMTAVGQRVKSLVGDPCLVEPVAMPARCEAIDETTTGQQPLPECTSAVTTDCFRVTHDATLCPATQQLKLEVVRSSPPAADTWTSLRCIQ